MIKKIIQHKDKLILMQLAIFQILVSFATNFIVVKKIGFGNELDVFYLAMAVYLFLTTSIGWSISSVLTPILIENSENNIFGKMFINIFLITFPLFIIILITSNLWINLIYTNYINNIDLNLIYVIQITLLVTFFIECLNLLFFAMLQKSNNYIKINAINLTGSLINFVFVYTFIDQLGIHAAAIAFLIPKILIFLFLFIKLFKLIKIDLYFDKRIFLLLWNRMKYIFIGSFYFRLNDLIDKFIASFLTTGFLSLVGFTQKIYDASNTVINTSIVAPTITKFSLLLKEKKYSVIKKTFFNYTIFLLLVNSFILLIIIIYGEKIFLSLFSDRIDPSILFILPLTLISLFTMGYTNTMGKVQQNLLLSLKAEKRITQYDIISFTIGIILKIILTYFFTIYGFLLSFILSELIKYIMKLYLLLKILKEKK